MPKKGSYNGLQVKPTTSTKVRRVPVPSASPFPLALEVAASHFANSVRRTVDGESARALRALSSVSSGFRSGVSAVRGDDPFSRGSFEPSKSRILSCFDPEVHVEMRREMNFSDSTRRSYSVTSILKRSDAVWQADVYVRHYKGTFGQIVLQASSRSDSPRALVTLRSEAVPVPSSLFWIAMRKAEPWTGRWVADLLEMIRVMAVGSFPSAGDVCGSSQTADDIKRWLGGVVWEYSAFDWLFPDDRTLGPAPNAMRGLRVVSEGGENYTIKREGWTYATIVMTDGGSRFNSRGGTSVSLEVDGTFLIRNVAEISDIGVAMHMLAFVERTKRVPQVLPTGGRFPTFDPIHKDGKTTRDMRTLRRYIKERGSVDSYSAKAPAPRDEVASIQKSEWEVTSTKVHDRDLFFTTHSVFRDGKLLEINVSPSTADNDSIYARFFRENEEDVLRETHEDVYRNYEPEFRTRLLGALSRSLPHGCLPSQLVGVDGRKIFP
jgi:hypothetical protein